MEKLTTKHYVMFAFVLAGLLFSGYLSATKLFTDTCAFGSQCPIFLGYPACYTGFIVYLILAVISVIALIKKSLNRLLLALITGVSLFGVLFSGKLTIAEMSVWFSDGFIAFIKSLPLCSIGLIFYTVIFILSLVIGNKMDKEIAKENDSIDFNKEEPKEAPKVEEIKEVAAPVNDVQKVEEVKEEPKVEEVKIEEVKTEEKKEDSPFQPGSEIK